MDKEDTETVAEFLRRMMVKRATTLLLADIGVHNPCQQHRAHHMLCTKIANQRENKIPRIIYIEED